MTGRIVRNDLGGRALVNRPQRGRELEDEIGVDAVPPEEPEPPSQKRKAEPVRRPLPPAMEQKLRDEHAAGATEAGLMRRWGLLHEEVTHALADTGD